MPEKTCKECACNKVCNHDLFGFENCGNFIPAVDVVEVRHGKWIRDSLTGHISCSNCKMTAPGDCELEDFYESDFCPNCGAKMDGKENGK